MNQDERKLSVGKRAEAVAIPPPSRRPFQEIIFRDRNRIYKNANLLITQLNKESIILILNQVLSTTNSQKHEKKSSNSNSD